jgi:hypothetical protein
MVAELNIDPVPVALRLWQQTRADGQLDQTRPAITDLQSAKTPDMLAQDRARQAGDQRADMASVFEKHQCAREGMIRLFLEAR